MVWVDDGVVGVVDEGLPAPGARHLLLAVGDAELLEVLLHPLEVTGGEGDVVEVAGIRGSVGAGLVAAGEMHHRHVAAIEPVAGKVEVGPRPGLEAKHALVELARLLEIRGLDVVVVERLDSHGATSWEPADSLAATPGGGQEVRDFQVRRWGGWPIRPTRSAPRNMVRVLARIGSV